MPRDLAPEAGGLIGPNAVLQVIPVLDRAVGPASRTRVLARWGGDLPDGSEMIPEGEAARLHAVLRHEFGPRAPGLAAQAGRGTAEYILAHRIPSAAQAILRALPAPLAARAMSNAIARNAWTFAGSGRFEVLSPWAFAIHDNPVIRGEESEAPLCHWHAAVFETLYRRLVHPAARCREVACAATGAPACRFEIVTG